MLLLLMASLAVPLAGEVFLSFPKYDGKSGKVNSQDMPPDAVILWHDDTVKVNGIAGVLTAGKTDLRLLPAWLAALKRANLKKRSALSGEQFIKLAWQSENGQYHRYLFIDGGTEQPVTFFHLETERPIPSACAWPKKIPQFSGSQAAVVIESAANKMTYCSFTGDCRDADLESAMMADFCKAGNWSKLPGTNRWLQKPETGEFLWFTLDNNGNGVCCIINGGK